MPPKNESSKANEAAHSVKNEGNQDVQAMLDSLDVEIPEKHQQQQQQRKNAGSRGGKPKPKQDEEEILGFLDELAAPRPSSRVDKKSGRNASSTQQHDLPKEAVPSVPTEPVQPASTASPKPQATTGVERSRVPQVSREDGEDGGWLGSFWSTASTTLRQTQERGRHLAQTFQDSPEGQYLQSHIKQNLSTITSISSSLINTLAPPIGSHEQLRVHTFHDMVGYFDVENISYIIFDRVMSQIEGGELIVQSGRGGARRNSTAGKRELNTCEGKEQAEKLARATLEKVTVDVISDDEKVVRKSDIYLSIQPTSFSEGESEGNIVNPEKHLAFVVYLLDPANALEFVTISQSVPWEWIEWVEQGQDYLLEWLEESIALSIAVVAQRYVGKRMGLGVSKGKEKEGGELARAGV